MCFIIGLVAVIGTFLLLFTERRGMYFRLFSQYYFTPRIAGRLRIVKTGYDEKGQIAILEGVGMDKIYALSCSYLPHKSAAGTEEVFVYRQKFPTGQNIYRYGSMETELLAVGREVDNSVTVVKGTRRITSDNEWRNIHLLVHTLNLLMYGSLVICLIICIVFFLTQSSVSAVMMTVFGLLALGLKLLFKAEHHGPALRIYSDVPKTPQRLSDDEYMRTAQSMGLDDNERRAFLREKERREIFEKMNPLFNKFYAKLKESVENPPIPPSQNEVLSSAVKVEMDRVCFASTAHPLTKAEAELEKMMAAKKQAAETSIPDEEETEIPAPEDTTSSVETGRERTEKSTSKKTKGTKGEDAGGKNDAAQTQQAPLDPQRKSDINHTDVEKAVVEEVEEEQMMQLRKNTMANNIKTIVIEDGEVKYEEDDHQTTSETVGTEFVQPGSCLSDRYESGAPPSDDDYAEVLKGRKIVCTTCGCISKAPNNPNWSKVKCPECNATIRRGRP